MSEIIKTKRCSKCKEIKEISEFSKDRSAKDGLHSQCKGCKTAYQQSKDGRACQKAYEQSDKGKATKKAYSQTEKSKAYKKAYLRVYGQSESRKAYLQSDAGKVARNRACLNCKTKYPEKTKATNAVATAVRAGRLPRPDSLKCSCGEQAQEYHHPDYSKPLLVIRKCVKCHKKIHSQ